jgi:multidrug efflux pump subunit AcrA (membrane-fusion protein)
MKPTRFLVLVFLLALCLHSSGCTRSNKGEEQEGSSPKPIVAVHTVPIVVGEAKEILTVTGRTDVVRKQRILSPVSGMVVTFPLLEGASVTAGQVLATILTKESQSALAGAEALERMAQTADQRAEAERTHRLAQTTARTVVVTASCDGVVASRTVNPGELVAENAELCTLVDLTSLVFVADVPIADAARVQKGMAATIRIASLETHGIPAEVDALLPRTDAQSQTIPVRLHLPTGRGGLLLRPDVGGTVDIVTGSHRDALLVPRSSVLRDDEKNTTSVVIVTPDSLSLAVPVHVGAMNDSMIEVISSSLKGGMPVITEGNYMIPDSTRVTVHTQELR